MALRTNIRLGQRQRLGLTQEIKSSLQYLALAGLRLERTLQDVVDSNPFLSVSNTHSAHDTPDWIETLTLPRPETVASALRELARDLFWNTQDRALANFLIDNVAENGLLNTPLAKIECPKDVSYENLKRIRTAFLNQGGLLADNHGQSLAAQASQQMQDGSLSEHLLSAVLHICKNLDQISQNSQQHLNLPPQIYAQAMDALSHLSLNPADQLNLEAAIIMPPDLIVEEKTAGKWHIQLNPLTNRSYEIDRDILAGLTSADQRRPEIAQALKTAQATVRALQARGQTLLSLMAFLCEQQSQALKKDKTDLRPLTQNEAAQALNLNPSTISRAIAGKTVQTPQGIWPLKYFFTALIDPDTQFSGAQLRAWLTKTIAHENPKQPKSDEMLSADLAMMGPKVSRRTVTKYRLQLRLPSAAQRRQIYARRANRSPITFRKEFS